MTISFVIYIYRALKYCSVTLRSTVLVHTSSLPKADVKVNDTWHFRTSTAARYSFFRRRSDDVLHI